jgi:3-oxoacyl-[acyl-carrier-protein] synthase II
MPSFSTRLLNGSDGVGLASFCRDKESALPAAEVNGLDPGEYFDIDTMRRLGKTAIFSLVASKLAVMDGDLALNEDDSVRIGMILGSHHGEFRSQYSCQAKLFEGSPNLVPPNRFLYLVPNTIAGEICARLRIRGPQFYLHDVEASSSLAVVLGFERMRQYDTEDYYLAGGVDSIDPDMYDLYHRAGALAESRSPGAQQDGLIMGEGSAIVLLERLDSALRRGVRVYGEVAGCAVTSSPAAATDGTGMAEAMSVAMDRAKIKARDVGAVIASAGSSQEDEYEAAALESAFADCPDVAVTSVKPFIGETFGASGAMSLMGGLAILRTGRVFSVPPPRFKVFKIKWAFEPIALQEPHVLVNSIARTSFRTTNVCIVLRAV